MSEQLSFDLEVLGRAWTPTSVGGSRQDNSSIDGDLRHPLSMPFRTQFNSLTKKRGSELTLCPGTTRKVSKSD